MGGAACDSLPYYVACSVSGRRPSSSASSAKVPHPVVCDAREEDHEAPRPDPRRAIGHQLSNGLIESTNTKIRLITRMAFGFKSADALIALAMLSLGTHRPVLPDR